jgi:hypothetical protein
MNRDKIMKPPIHFSDDQLREYSERHLAHEIEMLLWTASVLYGFSIAQLLRKTVEDKIAWATRSAYLEAFAMHSRNLIDFLYLKRHYKTDRKNDIVVEDYIAVSILDSHLLPITALLKDAKIKADKQIAHLASERLGYDMFATSWFYTEIIRDIFQAFNSIASFFPEDKSSEHFRAMVTPPQPPLFTVNWEAIISQSQPQKSLGVSIAIAMVESKGR